MFAWLGSAIFHNMFLEQKAELSAELQQCQPKLSC